MTNVRAGPSLAIAGTAMLQPIQNKAAISEKFTENRTKSAAYMTISALYKGTYRICGQNDI